MGSKGFVGDRNYSPASAQRALAGKNKTRKTDRKNGSAIDPGTGGINSIRDANDQCFKTPAQHRQAKFD